MFAPTIRKLAFPAIAAAIAATALVCSAPAQAQTTCTAGRIGFPAGKKGIYVNHANFATPHAVVVQPTNTAGYSTTSACTYFNVLKLKPTQFQIQHKRCDNGVPIATDYSVPIYWIMCKIPSS